MNALMPNVKYKDVVVSSYRGIRKKNDKRGFRHWLVQYVDDSFIDQVRMDILGVKSLLEHDGEC